MRLTRPIHLLMLTLATLCVIWPMSVNAQNELEQIERLQIDQTQVSTTAALEDIRQRVSAEALEAKVKEILSVDNMAPGERTYINDRASIQLYLDQFFESLAPQGLREIARIRGQAAVPVAIKREGLENVAAHITTSGEIFEVHPLWPNGIQPSLTPKQGLTGPLIDVRDASWDDLKGKDLKQAIAIMNFGGGRNFERVFSLGAQAIVIVEDTRVSTLDGQRLYSATPVPFPRFYVDQSTGEALKKYTGQEVTLNGGHVFENRPYEARFVYLPPTEPLTISITEGELLKWIAQDRGLRVEEIIQATEAQGGTIPTGAGLPEKFKLYFPDVDKPYSVKKNDLLIRIADFYEVDTQAIAAINPQINDGVPVGELKIPNLDETLSIMLPIDSMSVIPGEEHGAKVATNMALAMLWLEYLTQNTDQKRRKGLIVGFLDAENLAGLSSRKFTESWLDLSGKLQQDVAPRGRKFSITYALIAVIVGFFLGLVPAAFLIIRMDSDERGIRAYARVLFSNCIIFAMLGGIGTIIVESQFKRLNQTEVITVDQLNSDRYQRIQEYFQLRGAQINIRGDVIFTDDGNPTGLEYKDGDRTLVKGLNNEPGDESVDDIAIWFHKDWLNNYVEAVRVSLVEKRDEQRLLMQSMQDGNRVREGEEEEFKAAQALYNKYEVYKDYVVAIRRMTLDQRGFMGLGNSLSDAQKVNEFLNILEGVDDSIFPQIKQAILDGGTSQADQLDQLDYKVMPELVGLGYRPMVRRFAEEYQQVKQARALHDQNLVQTRQLIAFMHPALIREVADSDNADSQEVKQARKMLALIDQPERMPVLMDVQTALDKEDLKTLAWEIKKPVLGYYLAVSDGSQSLAMLNNGAFRGAHSIGKGVTAYTAKMKYTLDLLRKRPEWGLSQVPFLREEDRGEYTVMDLNDPAYYWDFWTEVKMGLLPLGTANDTQTRLDTPWDTVDRLRFDNLEVVGRNLLYLMTLGLENPASSKAPTSLKTPKFARLTGKTIQFNLRSGLDAREPVGGVGVYAPMPSKKSPTPFNQSAYQNARRPLIVISKLNGGWKMPLMSTGFVKQSNPVVYGFRMDESSGLFDRVVNQGQIGTQKKTAKFSLLPYQDNDRRLILTQAYPWTFFPEPDPVDYLSAGDRGQTIEVHNALSDAEPDNYARYNPLTDFLERDLNANTIYMEQGKRVRVIVKQGALNRLLLTGPLSYIDQKGNEIKTPKGYGYAVGPVDMEELNKADEHVKDKRNLVLSDTPYHIAKDMYSQANQRYTQLENFNIKDPSVRAALDLAQRKRDKAKAAKDANNWQLMVGSSRETWGTLVKYYPRILKLGREAVFSAVLLMALLTPASFFLERLVLGGKSIMRRLIGMVVIFILGTVLLNFLHPAFSIAVNPFILMVAFAMILMSLIVLMISYQRFEIIVRRARSSAGEVEADKISLGSTLSTALSLGVSNLKKRPSRTFLTAFTVTVLTFSIITFVSVTGEDDTMRKPATLGTTIEGQTVEAQQPLYSGALFREYMWAPLPAGLIASIESEFGTNFPVTMRANYIQRRGGNNEDREGTNQISILMLPDQSPITPMKDQTTLTKADVTDWSAILTLLVLRENNGLKRVWAMMTPDERDMIEALQSGSQVLQADHQDKIIAALNRIVLDPELYNPFDFSNVELKEKAKNLLELPTRDDTQIAQLGRHLMDSLFSEPSPREMIIKGLMGFQPNEVDFSQLNEAVNNKIWFKPTDRYHVILPSNVAAVLGITPTDLVDAQGQRRPDDQLPTVTMMNLTWKVIGILDVAKANTIRDLNGQSLALVDYLTSAFTPGTGLKDDLVNEPESYHYSWERLAILPITARGDVKMEPSSVAIRFESKEQETMFYDEVKSRMNRSMFASVADYTPEREEPQISDISIVSTQTSQSPSGLARILVPVILCVLIVMNTMLGNVEERKGEVGMLGAVGLSPRQISFLLLSESAVFSVLGIVFGLMGGLVFALITGTTGIMTELTVNFTSLISIILAMGSGLVVLLATLIPARKASALAAPSGMATWKLPEPDANSSIDFRLPFTLTRGNALGMMTFFRQFMLNHNDSASEDFNCRDVKISLVEGKDQALRLTGYMWLAPYDLDVAQELDLRVRATENPGVFAVDLTLKRNSGAEDAWIRVNYGFLNLVREQFLLWRNLTQEMRAQYIEQGATLFKEAERENG